MKGHVNQVRNARGAEWLRWRIKELERLNKAAPVIIVQPARRRAGDGKGVVK